jgi:hypothetical protein
MATKLTVGICCALLLLLAITAVMYLKYLNQRDGQPGSPPSTVEEDGEHLQQVRGAACSPSRRAAPPAHTQRAR